MRAARSVSVRSPLRLHSPPWETRALLLAVAENNQAHGRMTQLFNEKGGVEKAMLGLLGRLLYLELHDSQVPSFDLTFPGTVGAVLDTQQSPHETATR